MSDIIETVLSVHGNIIHITARQNREERRTNMADIANISSQVPVWTKQFLALPGKRTWIEL
jgi:hypothetical protein